MNDKVTTTTTNADGQTVTVIADNKAALTTAVTQTRLNAKQTRPNIDNKSDANKKHSELN